MSKTCVGTCKRKHTGAVVGAVANKYGYSLEPRPTTVEGDRSYALLMADDEEVRGMEEELRGFIQGVCWGKD